MQSVDADVVVGVCGVVDGEDVGEGLGGVGWELVGHVCGGIGRLFIY